MDVFSKLRQLETFSYLNTHEVVISNSPRESGKIRIHESFFDNVHSKAKSVQNKTILVKSTGQFRRDYTDGEIEEIFQTNLRLRPYILTPTEVSGLVTWLCKIETYEIQPRLMLSPTFGVLLYTEGYATLVKVDKGIFQVNTTAKGSAIRCFGMGMIIPS